MQHCVIDLCNSVKAASVYFFIKAEPVLWSRYIPARVQRLFQHVANTVSGDVDLQRSGVYAFHKRQIVFKK